MNEIGNLLSADPGDLLLSVNNETRKRLEANQGRVVFFGAGNLGEIALRDARRAGFEPRAFADNNRGKWGAECQGVPIMSPEDAVARFGGDSLFVITVYTAVPVWEQLRGLGVEPISFARLAWLYPAEFLPEQGLDLPHKIIQSAEAVRATEKIWSDEESRAEYIEQIRWRTTLTPDILRAHPPAGETYFAEDLFLLHDHEVFVDCGAFDGDSIRAFLHRVDGRFQKIIGLEPDPLNRVRFQEFRASLPPGQSDRIELLPYALGEKRGRVVFNATGTVASGLGEGGNEVECVPLDEVITLAPTFIKMDIEGAEPMALRGAANLLRTHRPILAICLYHAVEHLWEIPLWLKESAPDYELFFRRYCDECWEIVCYAIPSERWIRP